MHPIETGCVLISDVADIKKRLQPQLPHIKIMQLDEFIPDGKPVVFVLHGRNSGAAENRFRHLNPRVKTRSIITGRAGQGERIPQSLRRNTVLIPCCDDEIYGNWLQFLLGFPGIVPSPGWLFEYNSDVVGRADIQRLKTVIHDLVMDEICVLNAELLAQAYPCSRTSLTHYCKLLYGVPAGMLCRVWRVFTQTAVFMQEEQMLLPDGRYGRSPISCIDGDYLNSLERVIGVRYTDLRLAAQHEHWVAVWMRRWASWLTGR